MCTLNCVVFILLLLSHVPLASPLSSESPGVVGAAPMPPPLATPLIVYRTDFIDKDEDNENICNTDNN